MAGNRTYETYYGSRTEVEVDYEYDKNNRLISKTEDDCISNSVITTSYDYDKNGNRIKKSYHTIYPNSTNKITLGIEDYQSDLTTDVETYTYDGFNRLTQISKEGGNVYKYAYYPNGLRLSKDVNGTVTYFQWDGDNIWGLSANASNALTHYYYRGLYGNIKDNYGTAFVYNGHGDVVKLTNSDGSIKRNYDYDAFGIVNGANSADSNPWRYCGEYYDVETDNIYLRARYYDPSVGAFINEDPIIDGVNWYSYCMGNPVVYADYSGLDDVIIYTRSKNAFFEGQAVYQKNELEKLGKTVRLIPIEGDNCRKDFENAWNNLGYDPEGNYDVDDVYIFAHGNERTLILKHETQTEAFSIDGENRNGEEIGNIHDLKEKDVDNLYLYTCNAGNINQLFYGEQIKNGKGNVASAFSEIISGKVFAYDGNVSFGTSGIIGIIMTEITGNFPHRLSNNQDGFNEVIEKLEKEGIKSVNNSPLGQIMYKDGKFPI